MPSRSGWCDVVCLYTLTLNRRIRIRVPVLPKLGPLCTSVFRHTSTTCPFRCGSHSALAGSILMTTGLVPEAGNEPHLTAEIDHNKFPAQATCQLTRSLLVEFCEMSVFFNSVVTPLFSWWCPRVKFEVSALVSRESVTILNRWPIMLRRSDSSDALSPIAAYKTTLLSMSDTQHFLSDTVPSPPSLVIPCRLSHTYPTSS